jgi:hypothetical protein
VACVEEEPRALIFNRAEMCLERQIYKLRPCKQVAKMRDDGRWRIFKNRFVPLGRILID